MNTAERTVLMRVSKKELRVEVGRCQPSDRSPGSQKTHVKSRWRLKGGARSLTPTPGSGVVAVRVEGACWLGRGRDPVTAEVQPGLAPGGSVLPPLLAGSLVLISRAFSACGELLQLCPTDHVDRSLLMVVPSLSALIVCAVSFWTLSPPHLTCSCQSPGGPIPVCRIWCQSPGDQPAQMGHGGKTAFRGCGSPVVGVCQLAGRFASTPPPASVGGPPSFPRRGGGPRASGTKVEKMLSPVGLHRCPPGSCGRLSRWRGGIPATGPVSGCWVVVASLPCPALPQFLSVYGKHLPILQWF